MNTTLSCATADTSQQELKHCVYLLYQVCFTFHPVQEGCYQLPLFLRVKDGKQLQLQLNGRAVAPCAQLPLLVRGGQSCVLSPAPLGDLEPPLQCYTLRNGGPAPLHYK
jgi:hypothetical protein